MPGILKIPLILLLCTIGHSVIGQQCMTKQDRSGIVNRQQTGISSGNRNNANETGPGSNCRTYYIPVVVHVVYNLSVENIVDGQVNSQINVLNEDFRKLNSDTSNTPSVFKDIAKGLNIRFCLAQRDPNGIATGGITHTATTTSSFIDDDKIKSSSLGGADPWPSEDYLNIWVCNLSGNNAGYGTMPGGDKLLDGIVIDYEHFGRTGTATAPYDKGRTATHNAGHWLGLYHPSKDTCSGDSLQTCTIAGDLICDTPPMFDSPDTCGATFNTCTETPIDQIDQNSNFMDLNNDTCLNLYTSDQVQKMAACLNGARFSNANSLGCTPISSRDAGISAVFSPDKITCAASIFPSFQLTNYANDTLHDVLIRYFIDQPPFTQFNWTGAVPAGESKSVNLASMAVSQGRHTFTIYTYQPNGSFDLYEDNDTAIQKFYVDSGMGLTMPVLLDFEDRNCDPDSITITNPDGLITWSPSGVILSIDTMPTIAMHVSHFNYNDQSLPEDEITIRTIDMINAANPTLTFDLAYAKYSTANFEHLYIFASTDCGSTFDTVYYKFGSSLQTISTSQTKKEWVPSSPDHWRQECIDLSAYKGKSVSFTFQVVNGYGNDLYVDNINISDNICVTGLESVTYNYTNSFVLYPNPSQTGNFKLKWNSIGSKVVKLKVLNVLGQQVQTHVLNADAGPNEISIDLSQLPNGFYLVKVESNEVHYTLKAIKN